MEARASSGKRQEKWSGKWPAWHSALINYRESSTWTASWQLMNTLIPYLGLWFLMVQSIQRGYPYALTLVLATVAALFLVRLFILFHDCVHGSIFPQKALNSIVGHVLGLFVDTKSKRKERLSVLFTDLLLVGVILVASLTMGWQTYLLIQLPVLWLAGAMGIWLFYVQHQFKGGYWARKGDWDPIRAAMEGSSFYRLPRVLRWFSADIGYHHVHHLNPRIPNYRLKQCYDAVHPLREKPPLTIGQSLTGICLKLWDEERKELVGFP